MRFLFIFFSIKKCHKIPVTLTIEFDQYNVLNFAKLILHHKSILFQLDDMFQLFQYPFVLVVNVFDVRVNFAYVSKVNSNREK